MSNCSKDLCQFAQSILGNFEHPVDNVEHSEEVASVTRNIDGAIKREIPNKKGCLEGRIHVLLLTLPMNW